MAIFKTIVTDGNPKFHYKAGCHWRLSPDATEAVIEFKGTYEDYREAKNDVDTIELTRRQALEIVRQWDEIVWGGP